MNLRPTYLQFLRLVFVLVLLAAAVPADAQRVKRLVIIKVDGLPGYFLDEIRNTRDPATGKSTLPWIDEVFYRNGTRIPNFYSRGMSLSGPSWGLLDTGQHLQIKGNVEFDRYTLRTYDYLNLVPFYYGYTMGSVVDTTGVGVLDSLGIPLLVDAFPREQRYASQQLYQRGFDWGIFGGGFVNMIPRDRNDLIDEWTMGFDTRNLTVRQNERDVAERIVKRPDVDYLDYYDIGYDHGSHHNNDVASRVQLLKYLDRSVGHIWTAIQHSSRAGETALAIVSDHGFNSDPKVYSQGFNLVKLLGSSSGGGHHVITKRFLMMNFALKALNPFASIIRTSTNESYYLKGLAEKYPTVLLDFDGNERSSLHFRNSELNQLHLLLLELKKGQTKGALRDAAADTVLAMIERHRSEWQQNAVQFRQELDALDRWVTATKPTAIKLPTDQTADVKQEQAWANRRLRKSVLDAESDIALYRSYLASADRLLALRRDDLISGKFQIEDLIAPNAMGERNTIYDMQNYVVGLGMGGLRLGSDGKLDLNTSFKHIDYFKLLVAQRVRNNVQAGVSNRPIEFVSKRIPLDAIRDSLPAGDVPDDDPILLYGGEDAQVLVLTRMEANGEESYRYLPVKNLRQPEGGRVIFDRADTRPGLPLLYFEDPALAVSGDRRAFFDTWHTEVEWMRAVHRTIYSNGIIGINEQMDSHPLPAGETTGDAALIHRFRERQRRLTDADILIEASDHWNFDVRGFNPGGNHGSFLRVSTNSAFMIAGGAETGIPRGFTVEEPYDSLSFMPTLLRLMGRIDEKNRPTPAMAALGYRPFPGRVVSEIIR